jgi:RNA polymerase subunit RPABC4/transcription elongation factor Spt4
MIMPQNNNNVAEEFVAPRPYMWKTGEFGVNDNLPKLNQNIRQVEQLPHQPPYNQNFAPPMMYPRPPAHLMNTNYRCPRCNTQNLPFIKRQISTAGWITFAVLLVTTGIFFWIGLLIKEDVRVCPVCQTTVG